MKMQTNERSNHRRVYVWDPLVRIFHWSLLGLIAFSWYAGTVGGNMMEYHMWSGYTMLTLVLVRIAWGFVGTSYARFTSFLHAPRAIITDLFTLHRRESGVRVIGHTPLGGINIVLLITCLLVQAGTGLFANDDIFTEGPLYGLVGKDTSDWLTMIHHYNFNALLTLAGLHIVAVFYHLLHRRENLIAPMFTGYKKVAGALAAPATPFRPALALALLAIVAGAVWLLVN
ncbi:MAG: cytochrome b/b6 domain-containing protein [Gammaproteobacteria bacterium]|jgi:cytochrome b|nr:cytochrome b/b6 domain-containing protein [Gammaproteobacteria bacterium]